MFPGGGAGYVGMGSGLYEKEPAFRAALDRCLAFLESELELDISPILFPRSGDSSRIEAASERPSVALPVLFSVEYALAQLWISWGLCPSALIGHSLDTHCPVAMSQFSRARTQHALSPQVAPCAQQRSSDGM